MKQKSFFSAGDYVATKVLLVLVALLYPALVLVPQLLDLAAGRPLVLRGPGPDGAAPVVGEPPDGVVGRYDDTVIWSIAEPSVGQRVVVLLPVVVTTAFLAVGLVVLWRLVSATRRGVPFDRSMVRRLRVLGVLLLAYGLLAFFAAPMVLLAVFWSVPGTPVALGVDVPALLPVVLGFVVLVLAESFRVGLRLSEDVEGLV